MTDKLQLIRLKSDTVGCSRRCLRLSSIAAGVFSARFDYSPVIRLVRYIASNHSTFHFPCDGEITRVRVSCESSSAVPVDRRPDRAFGAEASTSIRRLLHLWPLRVGKLLAGK